jgi:hypothetical protein
MSAENLTLYNAVKEVPATAQKKFSTSTLKDFTDINPMWRIKTLTEKFGVCGIGWKYEITRQWSEAGADGEVSAFCDINLYVKVDGAWSAAIPGTGGSRMISKFARGLATSDECYKMALTDAISVACKALGFGAEIYWALDKTKYDKDGQDVPPASTTPAKPAPEHATPPRNEDTGLEILDACEALEKVGSRQDILAINKRYGTLFGEKGANPNKEYINLLMEKCHQFPKQ